MKDILDVIFLAVIALLLILGLPTLYLFGF